MNPDKPSAEQAVLDALQRQPDATAPDLASAVGMGRSTVSKILARLESAGRARRRAGARDGARRLPDRWSLVAEDSQERAVPAAAKPERLRPGQLDDLVLAYLREHASDGPLGPTTVARALARSSGAVGNCLARLAAGGRACQVDKRPRRYTISDKTPSAA